MRTHPETGRKALFVNRGFTTRIEGWTATKATRCWRCCTITPKRRSSSAGSSGTKNSVAFWDNRAAMHHAMWDYFPLSRLAHRVTICGDKPFYRA